VKLGGSRFPIELLPLAASRLDKEASWVAAPSGLGWVAVAPLDIVGKEKYVLVGDNDLDIEDEGWTNVKALFVDSCTVGGVLDCGNAVVEKGPEGFNVEGAAPPCDTGS
jgi:hypothetical protein